MYRNERFEISHKNKGILEWAIEIPKSFQQFAFDVQVSGDLPLGCDVRLARLNLLSELSFVFATPRGQRIAHAEMFGSKTPINMPSDARRVLVTGKCSPPPKGTRMLVDIIIVFWE